MLRSRSHAMHGSPPQVVRGRKRSCRGRRRAVQEPPDAPPLTGRGERRLVEEQHLRPVEDARRGRAPDACRRKNDRRGPAGLEAKQLQPVDRRPALLPGTPYRGRSESPRRSGRGRASFLKHADLPGPRRVLLDSIPRRAPSPARASAGRQHPDRVVLPAPFGRGSEELAGGTSSRSLDRRTGRSRSARSGRVAGATFRDSLAPPGTRRCRKISSPAVRETS